MAKTDLLVIEDWGLESMSNRERGNLLEVMVDRYDLKSTLITSQYPVSKWYELIGDSTMAETILNRIVHNAHKITLKGESMRKTKSYLTQTER